MSDLRDQLNALLIAKFDLKPDALVADQTLEGLGLDSLDIVKLATAMEGKFGVEFDEEELLDNITLDDLVELLGDRLSAGPARLGQVRARQTGGQRWRSRRPRQVPAARACRASTARSPSGSTT